LNKIDFGKGVSCNGNHVAYIKSKKDTNRARILVEKALSPRGRLIAEYIEENVRPTFKPELVKAVNVCNEKNASLIVPNISRLARDLTAVEILNRLHNKKVLAVKELNHIVRTYEYNTTQLLLMATDHLKDTGGLIKKRIAKKIKGGWKAGNRTNLNVATMNAAKARRELSDEYVKYIMPRIRKIQSRVYEKATLQDIADALMSQKIPTRRGKTTWTPAGVSNLLKKAATLGV
jgi:hypothetical protein